MRVLLFLIFVSSTFSFDIFERFMPFSGTVDTSLSINSTGSSTWNNFNVTGTLTGANVDLNAGNIDGIAIGQTTPSNAIFGITTSTTANITSINSTNANITTINSTNVNATNLNATSITKAAFNTPTITLSQDTDFVLSGGVNGLSVDGTTLSVDGVNNRIGIGTSSPSVKFDLVTGNTTNAAFHIGEAANEGAYFSSTSNNSLQIWAGSELDSNSIRARATEAAGITLNNGLAVFYSDSSLTPGNTYTQTERMRMTATGEFIVGGISTSYAIEAALGAVAGAGAYVNTSDKRLKTSTEPVQNACAILDELEPVYFNWKSKAQTDALTSADFQTSGRDFSKINAMPGGIKDVGFLAQDVQEHFPQAVNQNNLGIFNMSYSKIIPLLVACINEMRQ